MTFYERRCVKLVTTFSNPPTWHQPKRLTIFNPVLRLFHNPLLKPTFAPFCSAIYAIFNIPTGIKGRGKVKKERRQDLPYAQ